MVGSKIWNERLIMINRLFMKQETDPLQTMLDDLKIVYRRHVGAIFSPVIYTISNDDFHRLENKYPDYEFHRLRTR